MIDWEILRESFATIPDGLSVTLWIIALAAPFALALSIVLVFMRCSQMWILSALARGYSAFFRGTPLLVQLFFFYYGTANLDFIRNTPALWWLFADGFRVAILAIGLNSAAYVSEILIGGIKSVPQGVREAAAAIGMSRFVSFYKIELPIAWRQALPACGNELILLVKGTSLASTISVMDMMAYSKRLFSTTFAPLEVFIASACFYLLINFIFVCCIYLLENYFNRHLRVSK